jgi:hypothetical protein
MLSIRRSVMSLLLFGVVVTTVSAVAQTALRFTPVTPCRVVDTRNPNGQFGGPAIQGGTSRSFAIPEGACEIPSNAWGYSLNVTVVPSGPLGYLTVWPTSEVQPTVSNLNSADGRVKANAVTVLGTADGAAVSVFASDRTDVILDISGYYSPVSDTNLTFFPLTPCRVADTRNPDGPLGGPFLTADRERDFPLVEATACQVPPNAVAYSVNITALPHAALNYITVWGTGRPQPVVSTLNAPTGTVTANAAIVAAGRGGDIAVFPTADTDLIIDIDGYFASAASGGLSMYGVTPCRVLDTRTAGGPFNGEIAINVGASACAPSSTAQGFLVGATVVPPTALGYLTIWADGLSQPDVSTLNAYDGAIVSNMAIVTTIDGSIDAYAADPTNLVLDLFAYVAP